MCEHDSMIKPYYISKDIICYHCQTFLITVGLIEEEVAINKKYPLTTKNMLSPERINEKLCEQIVIHGTKKLVYWRGHFENVHPQEKILCAECYKTLWDTKKIGETTKDLFAKA